MSNYTIFRLKGMIGQICTTNWSYVCAKTLQSLVISCTSKYHFYFQSGVRPSEASSTTRQPSNLGEASVASLEVTEIWWVIITIFRLKGMIGQICTTNWNHLRERLFKLYISWASKAYYFQALSWVRPSNASSTLTRGEDQIDHFDF